MLAENVKKEQEKAKYRVIEEYFTSEEMRRRAHETIESIIRELKEVEDAEEWLESVLEINRYQSLVNGEWVTNSYEFLITSGGPTIYINTYGTIEYRWNMDKLVVVIEDEEALATLEDVEEFLDLSLS